MLKYLLWGGLALGVVVAALVYGRMQYGCPKGGPCVTSPKADGSGCCNPDSPECCPGEKEDSKPTPAQGNDPDKQVVFEVEGLTCPAVKGIGCGHMLRPVLASLDEIDGVEASSANYTGTMIRVSVTTASDRDKVAERVGKVLSDKGRKAVALAGDEARRALKEEQWRDRGRVGELSAIEFRTLALHRVKAFAREEKLGKGATDDLLKMAEEQWQRISKEAEKDKATRPEDWGNRCLECIPVLLAQAKTLLTEEQLERFKKALTNPCFDDGPEAPPPPFTKGNT